VYRHYVLAFHDETFECIAREHTLKAVVASFTDVLQECAREVVSE
jgi:hypothetical protein